MWAEAQDVGRKVLESLGANRRCSKRRVAQSAYLPPKDYGIPGATHIVQRVVCVGAKRRKWCSGRGFNFIRTHEATITLVDTAPPSVQILQNTPLASGAWVRGEQLLNYTAADNVGVQVARAVIGGLERGAQSGMRPRAATTGPFARRSRAPTESGQIDVKTTELAAEGTQQLVVEAQDSAGNRAAISPQSRRGSTTRPRPAST